MVLCEEIWKPAKDYEGLYEISNQGRVRGLDRKDPRGITVKGVILKFQEDKDGYYRVNLCKSGKKKPFRVNRLVAINFIENPDNLPVVNHKDGNKKNNKVENLEWCTRSENDLHAFRTGLRVPYNGGTNKHIAKVDIHTNKILETYASITEAASEIGVTTQAVTSCAHGRSRTCKGYNWIFIDEGVTTIENTLSN
jgi:hypothetical protein